VIATDRLVFQARQWVGVPFLHQGRTRNGCDCLGFIAGVLGEIGSTLFLEHLPTNYGRNPQALLIDGLTALVEQHVLQAGVLLLIEWPMSAFPSHAAIYTGESIVHAYEAAGKVIETGYRAPWPARTVSVWTLPGVTYE